MGGGVTKQIGSTVVSLTEPRQIDHGLNMYIYILIAVFEVRNDYSKEKKTHTHTYTKVGQMTIYLSTAVHNLDHLQWIL